MPYSSPPPWLARPAGIGFQAMVTTSATSENQAGATAQWSRLIPCPHDAVDRALALVPELASFNAARELEPLEYDARVPHRPFFRVVH